MKNMPRTARDRTDTESPMFFSPGPRRTKHKKNNPGDWLGTPEFGCFSLPRSIRIT